MSPGGHQEASGVRAKTPVRSPSSNLMAVRVGTRVQDWVCSKQLGSGSFGVVHVWTNETDGEVIALKKCRFGPEVPISEKVIQ